MRITLGKKWYRYKNPTKLHRPKTKLNIKNQQKLFKDLTLITRNASLGAIVANTPKKASKSQKEILDEVKRYAKKLAHNNAFYRSEIIKRQQAILKTNKKHRHAEQRQIKVAALVVKSDKIMAHFEKLPPAKQEKHQMEHLKFINKHNKIIDKYTEIKRKIHKYEARKIHYENDIEEFENIISKNETRIHKIESAYKKQTERTITYLKKVYTKHIKSTD